MLQKKKLILILLMALIRIPIGIFSLQTFTKTTGTRSFVGLMPSRDDIKSHNNPFNQRYSQGKYQGEGTVTFTYSSPMKIEVSSCSHLSSVRQAQDDPEHTEGSSGNCASGNAFRLLSIGKFSGVGLFFLAHLPKSEPTA